MTCGVRSDRVAVLTREAFAPFPVFGVTLVSGGHAAAQASAHALVVPESAWNTYRARLATRQGGGARLMPKLDLNVEHHPAVIEQFEKRTADAQLRLADRITDSAESDCPTSVRIETG